MTSDFDVECAAARFPTVSEMRSFLPVMPEAPDAAKATPDRIATPKIQHTTRLAIFLTARGS